MRLPSFKLVFCCDLLRNLEKFSLERIFFPDEFGDKSNLVDDLEEEVKSLSHIENDDLKTNIFRLEESNSQLENEVSHLQASC
jgi:hypothetical protein